MKINIATNNPPWTQFEKVEWAAADTEHYGKPLSWDKKYYHITVGEAGKTIGSLRMDFAVGVAYIDSVIVGRDKRGKGIGKSLIEKAEEIARRQGAHKIYLVTGKGWDAVKVYKKLGYKKSGDLQNHSYHADFIEMTKFLK